ncbi:NAD(P)H-binding protein [Portibacter marinus]|uniref:NAD(P)H-binding protein n=1 Tax=Portibacter marinus TaxID=2898660 RepID=UPI001F2F2554|nr:NAD(P)H-binding protein [Portibacter marinus]
MDTKRIALLGATGAVGSEVLKSLLKMEEVVKITSFGRRKIDQIDAPLLDQYLVDIFNADTYADHLVNHDVAICTLGVGQPSKLPRDEFVKIDKEAVLLFAQKCKEQGVKHFQLLSSVAINPNANNYYLRTKGELVEALKDIQFNRLSIFKPSMILTPQNRYGFAQGLTLKIWPVLSPLFLGQLKKYRGVKVENLGAAMAFNIRKAGKGFESLTWSDFQKILPEQMKR